MLEPAQPEVLDLQVMKLNVASVLDRQLMLGGPPALEFFTRELPEVMGRQLVASLRVPAQVLQDRRVVAEYPATLWEHIKKALGLRHRMVEVRLSENLVYPHVQVPHPHADRVRLWTMPSLTTSIR